MLRECTAKYKIGIITNTLRYSMQAISMLKHCTAKYIIGRIPNTDFMKAVWNLPTIPMWKVFIIGNRNFMRNRVNDSGDISQQTHPFINFL